MLKRYGWLLLLLIFPSITWANATVNQFLAEFKTLHAQFKQELYNEHGTLLETSQGEVYIQRPNQFRWDYQKPYQQLIVADGKKVWVYDVDLEQVSVRSVKKALGKTPAILLSSHTHVEEDFIVTELYSKEKGVERFELIPKDLDAQFDSIRLSLQNNRLKGFELVDNLGQLTLITFSKEQRNIEVDQKLFTFFPPAGVDVVEEAEE
jgi:outer membrane lipoprotein carrier protein